VRGELFAEDVVRARGAREVHGGGEALLEDVDGLVAEDVRDRVGGLQVEDREPGRVVDRVDGLDRALLPATARNGACGLARSPRIRRGTKPILPCAWRRWNSAAASPSSSRGLMKNS
jgi:hypothetical protein